MSHANVFYTPVNLLESVGFCGQCTWDGAVHESLTRMSCIAHLFYVPLIFTAAPSTLASCRLHSPAHTMVKWLMELNKSIERESRTWWNSVLNWPILPMPLLMHLWLDLNPQPCNPKTFTLAIKLSALYYIYSVWPTQCIVERKSRPWCEDILSWVGQYYQHHF